MRICLFTPTFLPSIGGQELVVDQLARQYNRLGHDAAVLAQHAHRWGTGQMGELPYEVVRFRKPFSQVRGVSVLQRALVKLRRRWPYELIHCHSTYPTGFAAVGAGARLQIPVVVTPHGGGIAETSRFRDRPEIMSRIRQALEQADAVTIMSGYIRERVGILAPGCAGRMHEISNGVDCAALATPVERTPEIAARWSAIPNPYLLFLGRLHRRKGVDVLIDAFLHAAARIPDAHLVIAGEGAEMEPLREQAGRSGSASRIHFVGMVQGADKLWLLQNALGVVLPTRTWEGMPIVVLEAMACARPVIGTDVGGIRDLVVPGQTGLLVKPQDATDLAEALVTLASQGPAWEQMSRNARAKAADYDWPVIARRYLSLFAELTGKRNGRQRSKSGGAR